MGQILVEGQALETLVNDWLDQIEALVGDGTVVIGIRSGGEELAARTVARLKAAGRGATLGLLDIALYRDDFGLRTGIPRVLGTEIPGDIDGRELLLVDDVFYTGRTARAALTRIGDLGRARVVRMATLARRPGHQVPIAPDVVAFEVDDPGPNQRVCLDFEAGQLRLEAGKR